ncbi:MAG: alpha/beta hydrolase [Candidatus Peribacteraceae bacterium]|nr:alpha/beta hydrolase [Candidatus Peribacteraceae bacterium]
MPTLFLIHGSYGHPEENWFPWLKGELEKRGCRVIVPAFPTPEDQNLQNWKRVLRQDDAAIAKDSIFVGHSLGVAFILRLLERRKAPVDSAFLVAGFLRPLGRPEFDIPNVSFLEGHYNWGRIRQVCGHFEVFQSDNDPYVPVACGEELAEKLGVPLTSVPGAGHFSEKAGYKKFELLLERIVERL